jgi:transposase
MHNYPSDISREQFELIREDLENAKKKTKPRKLDLYDIFCAVLYIVKGGIGWRMLPSDFPNWKVVYYYFTVWSREREDNTTLLSDVLKKISDDNKKLRPAKR